MKTERTMEILKDFKMLGIPASVKDKRFKLVLEYQDCIMQSSPEDVAKFERGLDNENRKIFFWVNANTLGMDSFLEILKSTYIRRKAQDIIDTEIEKENDRYSAMFAEVHNERDELEGRIDTFKRMKKPIHKRIKKMRDRIRDLEDMDKTSRITTGSMLAEIEELHTHIQGDIGLYKAKAKKYDELRSLLA